jgi:hypothetical protein
MRTLVLAACVLAGAAPLAAQPNPFKPPKSNVPSAEVHYTMSGDMSGTAMTAMDGERSVRRQTTSMKMMGKTIAVDDWTLRTPDSSYHADLTKKTGTVGPNLLLYMARAYDDLDGDGKKRLHQNMQDMAGMLSKAFGAGTLTGGEKIGTKTFAGQECEERQFGTFTLCSMSRAPIMLHTQASMVCLNYEETATEVKIGPAFAPETFAPPAGITFKPDPNMQQPDSVAKGFVGYMASQALADSLAKARAALDSAKAKQGQSGQPTQLTPEQQASMQQACDAIKNFDMGKAIADASSQFMKNLGEEAKREAANAAKNAATNKLKGLFKKPKIP